MLSINYYVYVSLHGYHPRRHTRLHDQTRLLPCPVLAKTLNPMRLGIQTVPASVVFTIDVIYKNRDSKKKPTVSS